MLQFENHAAGAMLWSSSYFVWGIRQEHTDYKLVTECMPNTAVLLTVIIKWKQMLNKNENKASYNFQPHTYTSNCQRAIGRQIIHRNLHARETFISKTIPADNNFLGMTRASFNGEFREWNKQYNICPSGTICKKFKPYRSYYDVFCWKKWNQTSSMATALGMNGGRFSSSHKRILFQVRINVFHSFHYFNRRWYCFWKEISSIVWIVEQIYFYSLKYNCCAMTNSWQWK